MNFLILIIKLIELLRSEIFKDEQKKTLLESIIHPLVREQILKFIENSKSIYKLLWYLYF